MNKTVTASAKIKFKIDGSTGVDEIKHDFSEAHVITGHNVNEVTTFCFSNKKFYTNIVGDAYEITTTLVLRKVEKHA